MALGTNDDVYNVDHHTWTLTVTVRPTYFSNTLQTYTLIIFVIHLAKLLFVSDCTVPQKSTSDPQLQLKRVHRKNTLL